uniref:ATP synthase subunit d, mitochondrial n=1 Tax=Globodera rostochiensis TaxID=31243 RepID=A0A914IAV5_GLORO
MAQPAKRIAVSSINWAKLAERLTPQQEDELNRLKVQNSSYHAEVVQHQADVPKKQWEALNIPYGAVPDNLKKQIDQWVQYNDARIKFHDLKTVDGLEEMKKIEDKWAKMPPVEQLWRDQLVQFFPHEHQDLRYLNEYYDPYHWGLNDSNWRERFKDFKSGPREGATLGH